jgi:alkylation response protein AidB-like acyl-CoA dehydrogenase
MRLTDEQRNVRDLASRFAKEVIRPAAVEADREQKLPLDVIKRVGSPGSQISRSRSRSAATNSPI